nr:MAG TPA: hypothetical protein [Caudoviricetes sp.]DAT69568.1 MAG TPA: hypothetical protein [Caudoviricetes sp.]
MGIMKGIDVSRYQGKINWERVKEDGVEFAILRAGYGMYENQIDPTFEYNYTECQKYNIPVGAYWYSYATSVKEGQEEAEIFLKTINGKILELGAWMDQEYETSIQALSKQARTDICITFMEKIKAAGFRTGLYCSYDWIKNWLYPAKLQNYDKWIAQYSSNCSYSGKDLALWQYSSKGTIDGITGSVDLDYLYKDYLTSQKVGIWKKNTKGWWYEYSDGSYIKNDWLKLDDRWYYFDKNGYALKGYATIDGKQYYFAEKYALGNIKECQLIMTNESGELL